MANLVNLVEVCAALTLAAPDRVFVTRGQVVGVKRMRGSCYFALADPSAPLRTGDDARLPCVLLRRNAAQIDFWVTVGQMVEVEGYAECFRGRWQLYVVEARLVRGGPEWPVGYHYRSARRIVDRFNRLLEGLLGPARE